MSQGDDRKSDDPVVAWDTPGWGPANKPAPSEPAAPAAAESKALSRQEIEPTRAKPDDARHLSRKQRKQREHREHREQREAAGEETWQANATPGTGAAAAAAAVSVSGPLVGRGLLMLLAAAYLSWVAALCYNELGPLHAQATAAAGARLAELQQTHGQIVKLTLANAAGGALFGLAGLLLIIGRRGLGKTLVFFGAVFLVGFLYLHFKHAQPLLRELDLLLKLIVLSLAALSVRR